MPQSGPQTSSIVMPDVVGERKDGECPRAARRCLVPLLMPSTDSTLPQSATFGRRISITGSCSLPSALVICIHCCSAIISLVNMNGIRNDEKAKPCNRVLQKSIINYDYFAICGHQHNTTQSTSHSTPLQNPIIRSHPLEHGRCCVTLPDVKHWRGTQAGF